ncbi:NAD(P)H-dependent glycerol-3-phosphate dehydrogenase [Serpentinicella sp. ANB-PHB4]|uniref:NAD(P)H-dependent glycerol-3-phosphate dehydrogenase n=1 Tax=Serpentinicella sp. ANB-PHB4 TaxID=3074076 RepID=UPI00285A20D4|nr:NAD(P)H-dependent glycerol-3-phosphate dehydrogenase [Serpentinicella sp. ANB-PHB4]MDR5657916.1 NAD(P)H-dependent glycerol-3-phosphate dehydrogenase [Serpentinicella sp. ANB-PHB4]
MKKVNVTVLGAGSFGTALAYSLGNSGHNVKLWMRNEKQYEEMKATKINRKYLPNIMLPHTVDYMLDIEKALANSDIILLAVPTQKVRQLLIKIKPIVKKEQILVNVAKGLEENSHLRISEVIKEALDNHPFAILSGPSHAEEVGKDMPTTLVVAAENKEIAEYVQMVFMTSVVRVYTNPDVIGVELGGALKNVIAFGAGIVDGLGFGDNAKAALMTRGIREIARLGDSMGSNVYTFAGLSGIGDLIVTCTSMHSRNRRAGILIGEGKTLAETLEEIGMVVEGITTTKVAYELAKKRNIDMPITEQIYNVLYNNHDVKESVIKLMSRNKKQEIEEIYEEEKIEW